ncbi:MAG: hypothetical protein ACPGRD_12080, partial [Planktomarina sp.]
FRAYIERMKRRMFTFGLAALAAAPALPLAAPSLPSGAAASRFATAKLIARAHNHCSPAMLQRLLRVDASLAAELNSMLLNRGVITAAAANGTSMAVNPMNTNCVPTEALKPTNLTQSVSKVREQLQNIWDKHGDALKDAVAEDDDIPPQDDPN